MSDKNTSNPADKNTPTLPPDVAKQLSTIDGAEALVRQYKTMALGTGSDGGNARIELCIQAAQQQARYLGFLAKVAAAKKARASATLTAGNRVKACSDELSSARAALDELTGGLNNVTAKIADLKSAVTQKDQELTDAAAHARQDFELAMDADNEIAQRAAAEQLSQAEVNLGMFRQHGPDNLRLRVLEARREEALVAPLQRALNEVSDGVKAIQKDLQATQQAGDQSAQTLTNVAIKAERLGGVQGPIHLKRGLAGAGDAAESAQRKMGRFSGMLEKLPGLAQRATTAFIGLAAAQRTITAPVKAFANLEEANTALKVTMMTKGGKISSNYGEIQKIAVDLGNRLPGSTRDFVTAANELLSLGVNEKAVVNGGLTAAAHLGVVLHMPQQQAAETVAKMREAYNLKDEELPGMADEIQRNRFAFGIQPSDLLLAAKYSAPTLNTLGLNGKKSMSEILTLQGMANLKGMDGSQFGTNFDMMLQRLAKGPLMLEQAKRGMKAEARNVLDKSGIKFDFYDSKGHLKTEDGSAVKGMLRELEKLELIRQKFGDKAAMEVAGGVFGQEAARPAQILAQYGVKGYEAARERVNNQATLEERTTESLTTLNAKIEAVSGSFENLQANMGKQLGEGAKPGLEKANDLLGSATDFAAQHPAAGTATVLGAGAGAGWTAWKASGAIWSKITGAGGAEAAGAATEGVAAGGGRLLGMLRGAGPAAVLLTIANGLFLTSDEDMAVLRAAESKKQGYRGKGFDDPRRLDRADGGEDARDAAMQASAQQVLSLMSPVLSRMDALSNRPVVLTVDGHVLAQSLDKQNIREARRN